MREASRAVVVGHRSVFQSSGGGVQACHAEYMELLAAGGFDLARVTFEFERGFAARIADRLFPKVVSAPLPASLASRIAAAVAESGARDVFFSFNLDPRTSDALRRDCPDVRQVLLSYGIESVDFLVRQATGEFRNARAASMLGRQLLVEARERSHIDAVVTLAPHEAEIERWLGAARVLWLPRSIRHFAIDAAPVDGRVGCVSTLNHPPNFDGLRRLFDSLEVQGPHGGLSFRLVGGPADRGESLARRYSFVEYLGPLPDDALEAEARTWCCFAHPLFAWAKGCSMKLALALGWQLPIATTAAGARGYEWDSAVLPLTESPAELAREVLSRSRSAQFGQYREQSRRIASLAPTSAEAGARLRSFVESVPAQGVRR